MSTIAAWGRPTWKLLHVISFSWDEKLINNYITFMKLLSKTIPCPRCKKHFNRNIKKPNLGIWKNCQSRDAMSRWLIKLHNMVNKKHGDRVFKYDKAKSFYIKNGKLKYDKHLIASFFKTSYDFILRYSRLVDNLVDNF